MQNNILKKILVALIIIFVAVVGGIAVYSAFKKPHNTQTPTTTDNSKKDDIGKKEVAVTQMPAKFPTDMPMEAGASITQNYNAYPKDGSVQATRVFVTSKSLAENYSIYQSYLKNNGWDIKSSIDQDNYKMLYGVKGAGNLNISIDSNTDTKMKTVSITYTELSGENN